MGGPGAGYADRGRPGVHDVTVDEDFLRRLVERFLTARLARNVENVLEYERRGTVWRP